MPATDGLGRKRFPRLRWFSVVAVAAGLSLAIMIADSIMEMRSGERLGIRTSERVGAKAEDQSGSYDCSGVSGQECRSAQLGIYSICSEPLNADISTWTTALAVAPDFAQCGGDGCGDPPDSTVKECNPSAFDPGYGVSTQGPSDPTFSNVTTTLTSAAVAALPSGHSISYAPTLEVDGSRIRVQGELAVHWWDMLTSMAGQLDGRFSLRFYTYHASDHEVKPQGSCGNYKLIHANKGGSSWVTNWPMLDVHVSTFGGYPGVKPNFYNWSSEADNQWTYNGGANTIHYCCGVVGAPGFEKSAALSHFHQLNLLQTDLMRGKWTRWEVVIDRANAEGWRYRLFAKNVTDGFVEKLVFDTWEACNAGVPPAGCDWDNDDWIGFQDVDPTAASMDEWKVATWASGSCVGEVYLSHVLYAGWPWAARDRIGAAKEFENVLGCPGGTDAYERCLN